LLNKDLYTDMG